MKRRLLSFILAGALLPATAWSQSLPAGAARGAAPNVETDPIRCWWRSSSGAVRIGERFTVTLTCAVLQTDAVQVTPDESRLDSAVIQLSPFEVFAGSHPADLYTGNRRFFQYDYVLRVIGPDVIGKDVKIPDPPMHYRVNSSVAENGALQGREHTYLLPPLSVRVLSLVPVDAPDIRDSAKDGFGTAEQLGFRANVLQIVGTAAIALGSLIALMGIVTLLVRTRKKKTVGKRGLSEGAILGRAGRELGAVQREAGGGWNEALVGRALTATRIAGASAIGRAIDQRTGAGVQGGEGRITFGGRWPRKATVVSGAATPEDLARALDRTFAAASGDRRQIVEDLQTALATFTKVQYAATANFDQTELDEALTRAIGATKRLRSYRVWPITYFRTWMPRVETQRA